MPSLKKVAAGLAATVLLGVPIAAGAAAPAVTGPMAFDPIAGSAYGQLTNAWTEPFIVPEGFSQTLLSDETDLNIYPGTTDDLHDMNTVNETGKWAGKYLYRTHEVGNDGALSVVNLETGEAKIFAKEGDPVDQTESDWRRLDGLRWTPWGTLLFAEETAQGHLFEAFVDPSDPSVATAVLDRPALGRLRHEGIEVGSDGSVYVIDELNGGSIFRFVPDRRGDLSSGQLYALKIQGISDAAQLWGAYNPVTNPHTGAFQWVELDQDQVEIDADVAANAVAATEFGRPEDIEIIGQILYVANTSEDRVIAIDLSKQTVSTFVLAGLNVPVEDEGDEITGLSSPDNLAEGPDGRLWIVEDNVPSDIWVADKDLDKDGAADNVYLFASLVDSGAEGTGIYFGKDPKTLFVNVQHASKPLADGTWMITKD